MKKKYVTPKVLNIIYAKAIMESGSVQGVNGGNHNIANGGHGSDTDEVDSKQNPFNAWATWDE